ncbi:MAG: HAMP domain-containing histidine kinase [Massilia sp.]|nr:HAMP domain-containing histidine kinase [Massilia sp.]
MRDTVATYAAQLRRANCHVDVDVAPKLMLDSYPDRLGQVLSNLINNALLHAFAARAAARIVIRASALEAVQTEASGPPIRRAQVGGRRSVFASPCFAHPAGACASRACSHVRRGDQARLICHRRGLSLNTMDTVVDKE